MIFPDRAQLAAASANPRDHLAAQGPERENLHAMRTLDQAPVNRAESAVWRIFRVSPVFWWSVIGGIA